MMKRLAVLAIAALLLVVPQLAFAAPKQTTTIAPKPAQQATTTDPKKAGEGEVAVYRLFHSKTGEHLYTTDANERNVLRGSHGWRYEGVGWFAPAEGTKGAKPVYRLFDPRTDEHLYTADANEKRVLSSKARGWRYEGVAWYSGGKVSVKRLYSPRAKKLASHHYTLDANEVKVLTSSREWRGEGEAWRALREGFQVKDGWVLEYGRWRYYRMDKVVTGERWISTAESPTAEANPGVQRYRLSKGGYARTGLFKVDGKSYYGVPGKFHILRNDWHKFGGDWWYGDANGTLSKRWAGLLSQYRTNKSVKQLLFVKYTGGTRANIELWVKSSGSWKRKLTCQGYVGRRGIGVTREGLARTPEGTWNVTGAFGIKSSPGTKLSYLKVQWYHYWCGDSVAYNRLIDIRKTPHICHGEHLIDYRGACDYGLFFDYNTNPIVMGKGAAFFVHNSNGYTHTAGCISMSEANMVKVIKALSPGAKLCVYPN